MIARPSAPPHASLVARSAILALALSLVPAARATMQFQQIFLDRYLAEHRDRDFVEYVRCQAKCYTCHQGCEDRKNHNAYGRELAKRLDAIADRDNVEKVLAALHEVEQLPAEPATPGGPTFGERITASKLPAGDLEDAKREPCEE